LAVKCKDIAKLIESQAPVKLSEEWDNVGLLLGSLENEVKRIMVCMDVTTKIADEAAAKGVDLIVSHHPLIFRGMKRINEDDPKGKVIYKLIRNNINVYCAHTNFDVADGGLNDRLAEIIDLKDVKNLRCYKQEKLYKVVVFVPEDKVDDVRDAMCSAGAGWIGNYSDCSFMAGGIGTFRPLDGTNPYIGAKGKLEKVNEYRLETIVPESLLKKVVEAMIKAHPYEEVAYDIYLTELKGMEYGMGKVGYLEQPLKLEEFIDMVKEKLKVSTVRVIGPSPDTVSKVGVFCGSFDEDYSGILKEKTDVLLTGDIKYHTAVDMTEMGLCVVDAGHFNTEKIFVPAVMKLFKDTFRDIDVIASQVESDPFKFS